MKMKLLENRFKKRKQPNKNNTPPKSNAPIRVLYKKVNEFPKVKIIKNIKQFERAVVLMGLDIVPYENAKSFILCNNQKYSNEMPINVYFSLFNISGDLIIVNIDSKERQFTGLTQEQIMFYTEDLMRRIPNEDTETNTRKSKQDNQAPYERDFEPSRTETREMQNDNIKQFQQGNSNQIIGHLISIELMLAKILKSKESDEDEQ